MKTQREKGRSAGFSILFLILFIGVLFPIQSRAGTILTEIKVNPMAMDVSRNETTLLSWDQSAKGKVEVYICSLDGKIVQTLLNREEREAGPQQVRWDGRDEFGRTCPTGAYVPIIRVVTKIRGYEVHNPTAAEWGQRIMPEKIAYKNSKITFHLNRAVLYLLRIGEQNGGPLYKTSFYWEPKSAGNQEIAWDGKDADGLFPVMKRKKAVIDFEAFTVPENAILLTGSNTRSLAPDRTYKTYPIHPPVGNDASGFAVYFRNDFQDIKISSSLNRSGMQGSGNQALKGRQTLSVTLAEEGNLPDLLRDGLEVYVFVDGDFFYDLPLAKVPFDFEFDTAKLKNGEHIVTFNVKTRSGQVGIHSRKIMVKN